MHLEKKKHTSISNKNVVNVIINTQKNSKSKHRQNKGHAEQQGYSSSSSSSSMPFSNSADLQHEILRQTLHDSPQINRPSNPIFKIRDDDASDSFIAEGSASPQVNLGEDFSYSNFPFKTPSKPFKLISGSFKPKPKRSYKAEREILKEKYVRLGGNNPIILNSTQKATIVNAIAQLAEAS